MLDIRHKPLTILSHRRPYPLGTQPRHIIIQTLDPLQKGLPSRQHQHHSAPRQRTVFPAYDAPSVTNARRKASGEGLTLSKPMMTMLNSSFRVRYSWNPRRRWYILRAEEGRGEGVEEAWQGRTALLYAAWGDINGPKVSGYSAKGEFCGKPRAIERSGCLGIETSETDPVEMKHERKDQRGKERERNRNRHRKEGRTIEKQTRPPRERPCASTS